MYKIKNYLFLLCVGFLAIATSCEQEGLTDEELQNLTQSTSLTVSAMQQGSQRPVVGVAVSVFSGGNTFEAVTDQYGQAYFEDVSQGDAIIQLTKEGYFELREQRQIESSGRLAGDRVSLSLYAEEDAATVKGQVKIQTDLTTKATEYAESINFNILSDGNIVASGSTGEEGRFEILVPTSENGRFFSLEFPEISRDQKVYVLEDSVAVLKTALNSIFRPYEEAEKLPNTSNIVLEVEEPNYNNGWQAYVESFEVDSTITAVTLGDIGYGYSNYPSIYAYVNGVSTNVNMELYAQYNSNFCNYPQYYQIVRNSLQIYDGGSGYPEYEPNLNISTMHPSGFRWDRCNDLNERFRIRTAEVVELNLDYGTGTVTGTLQ